jgi:glycosyltransferase involved in cell wall biosynthesis
VAVSGGRVARTIVSYFPRVTGPGKQVYEISRRLGEYGYTSPVFTTTPGKDVSHDLNGRERFETKRFPVTVPFMGFDFSLPFAKAIMKEPLDLIHSHGYRDFLALQSSLAAGVREKPFILQPHGQLVTYRYILPRDQWYPYTAYDRLCQRVALEADKVVVSATSEAREAKEFGVDPSKIVVIPPGLASAVEPNRYRGKGIFRVLFVGRISPGRNVHNLIEAFSRVLNKKDGVLTIVGGEEKLSKREEGGYLDRLRAQALSSPGGNCIEFTGPLYGADLERMYESSNLFVCASRYESFSQPIMEAAAHGLPVISTPVGIASDIITSGRTGYLVQPDDVDGFAERIQELLDDREEARDMGLRLLDVVKGRFDWDQIVRHYVSLYESVGV